MKFTLPRIQPSVPRGFSSYKLTMLERKTKSLFLAQFHFVGAPWSMATDRLSRSQYPLSTQPVYSYSLVVLVHFRRNYPATPRGGTTHRRRETFNRFENWEIKDRTRVQDMSDFYRLKLPAVLVHQAGLAPSPVVGLSYPIGH